MLDIQDIQFILEHRRFPIRNQIKRQMNRAIRLLIIPIIGLWPFFMIPAMQNISSNYYLSLLLFILPLIFFLVVLYSFYRSLYFTKVVTTNSTIENIRRMILYLEKERINLYQITENCYFIRRQIRADKEAKEVVVMTFKGNKLLMNRMIINSSRFNSSFMSKPRYFKIFVSSLTEAIV